MAYSQRGDIYRKNHPTSNIPFSTVNIPNIDEIVRETRGLHSQIPMFRLVSWDWAVDAFETPVLIEANLCNGELDFHQLNNGPVFGNDTESILKEVFGER